MTQIYFSIIIATYNRPDRLVQCLESFLRLDYPAGKWELIVVNDGGESSFDQMRDDLRQQLPLQLMTVPHRGPATARNAGALCAQGKYLVFVDDDCVIEPDWLKCYEEGFQETSADALGGQTINPYPDNIPAATWQSYLDFLRTKCFIDEHGNTLLLPSNNLAYRFAIFETLGGFDESFPTAAGEDDELGLRLVNQGYCQKFYPKAKVAHYHRSSYWGYIRQQFRYGRGAYYFGQVTHRKGIPIPPKWKPYEHYWHLGCWLWHTRGPMPSWILMGLSPLIHRLGRLYESLRRHKSS
jgi:glycosyltransferase involved in cell wall biosynthesis